MAFPYAERDFSLYSSSTNEGSVGKAHHDLDRCAHILNEVLDNGAGILEGVKKRKSFSSPSRESAVTQQKKVKQANRILPAENVPRGTKLSSSTPFTTPQHTQKRRQRSSSASSISNFYSRGRAQRRQRSLSEQRSCSVSSSSQRLRQRSCSSSSRRPMSAQGRSTKLLDSINSVLANHSLTSSEADTLTGVHLDNSSQFGIPPVFNAQGEKRSCRTSRTTRTRCQLATGQAASVGWLKPHASISTQTAVDKENIPDKKSKVQRKKKESKLACKKELSNSQKSSVVRIPCVQSNVVSDEKLSPFRTSTSSNTKEHDVDEMLERTLTQEHVCTQMELENRTSSQSQITDSSDIIRMLMERLRDAARAHDESGFDEEVERVSKAVSEMLADSHTPTSIQQLLVPFQREAKELRQQVTLLKQQLAKDVPRQQQDDVPRQRRTDVTKHTEDGNCLTSDNLEQIQLSSRDLSLKVVAAETRNTQLSNQVAGLYTELSEEKQKVAQLQAQVEFLTRQNKEKTTDKPAVVESSGRKLLVLQQSVRLLHTRLSDIASQCDLRTARQINSLLELCAQKLIESMDGSLQQTLQFNRNNNSRWESKPDNLAELVTSNLLKTRAIDKVGTEHDGSTLRQQFLNPHAYDGTKSTDTPAFLRADAALATSSQQWQAPTSRYSVSHSPNLPTKMSHPPEALGSPEDNLHSTLRSNNLDGSVTELDMSGTSMSTLSLGTTLADNAFQEGLAQLDANIARLQQSLQSSRFSSSM